MSSRVVHILTGNLLNSRSSQLNSLQGSKKIDDIVKYIIDTNDDSLDIIGKVELHFHKIERSDLDITVFIKTDLDLDNLKESLDFFKKTLNLERIDTVVLVCDIGNLYNEIQHDMSDFMKLYSYLINSKEIDSVGVFEFSPQQLDYLKDNSSYPKYNFIQLEYCCVPPQMLVKHCVANDIEILSMDQFEIEHPQELDLSRVISSIKYVMNIKSRSVCTHQGYIIKAEKK